MNRHVSKEQIEIAKNCELAPFLRDNYGDRYYDDGTSLHPVDNKSLSIKYGYHGYRDFATDERGNSIDYLIYHLGYDFCDAVNALYDYAYGNSPILDLTPEIQEFIETLGEVPVYAPAVAETAEVRKEITLPLKLQSYPSRVVNYLMKREIPERVIRNLIYHDLIYQSKEHNNAVFVSADSDFAEIRGTSSIPFHGCRNSRSDGYWYFLASYIGMDGNEQPHYKAATYVYFAHGEEFDPKDFTAYICESAIDAISLYTQRKELQLAPNSMFCSIGGVAKQRAIDRIVSEGYREVVLAVDNDKAGDDCAARNPNLTRLLPNGKDWNEDLVNKKRSGIHIPQDCRDPFVIRKKENTVIINGEGGASR